jgi:HTH-type transcriptional regulator / antitoxin HigA
MNIKPIKSETDYKEALARIEVLWDAEPNTKKGDELSVLAILVENYESEKYRILHPDPIEAIKFRMDQSGLKKTDLARYLGGRNRPTEILNGKRSLSVRMMRVLHNKLHIPAASLLAESEISRKPKAA